MLFHILIFLLLLMLGNATLIYLFLFFIILQLLLGDIATAIINVMILIYIFMFPFRSNILTHTFALYLIVSTILVLCIEYLKRKKIIVSQYHPFLDKCQEVHIVYKEDSFEIEEKASHLESLGCNTYLKKVESKEDLLSYANEKDAQIISRNMMNFIVFLSAMNGFLFILLNILFIIFILSNFSLLFILFLVPLFVWFLF